MPALPTELSNRTRGDSRVPKLAIILMRSAWGVFPIRDTVLIPWTRKAYATTPTIEPRMSANSSSGDNGWKTHVCDGHNQVWEVRIDHHASRTFTLVLSRRWQRHDELFNDLAVIAEPQGRYPGAQEVMSHNSHGYLGLGRRARLNICHAHKGFWQLFTLTLRYKVVRLLDSLPVRNVKILTTCVHRQTTLAYCVVAVILTLTFPTVDRILD